MDIQVLDTAIEFQNAQNYCFKREAGQGFYTIISFNSPCENRVTKGSSLAKAGDIIIHDSREDEERQGVPFKDGWSDDYINLGGEHFHDLMQSFDFPLNEVLQIRTPGLLRPYIQQIRLEESAKDLHWQQAVHAQATSMLIEIQRALSRVSEERKLNLRASTQYKLIKARARILANIEHAWGVEEMASLVELSSRRFREVYRTQFNISPNEDLLRARMEMACKLLVQTDISLREVSERVGYTDPAYFNRLFSKRIQQAPGTYRKKLQMEKLRERPRE